MITPHSTLEGMGTVDRSSDNRVYSSVERTPKKEGLAARIGKYLKGCYHDELNYRACIREFQQITDLRTHTGRIVNRYGIVGLLNYLKSPAQLKIASEKATWAGLIKKDSPLSGRLGHHAMIILPGDEDRVCEMTKQEKKHLVKSEICQLETRWVTGKVIEDLWKSHQEMLPKQLQWGFFSKEGRIHYRLFTNDCFTYVNRLLIKHNLTETVLSRAPDNEEELRSLVNIVSSTVSTFLKLAFRL